ncbi:hypothetical protein NDU88_006702 [Pleurodeles waltl]|uniref:Uncharacterized protein n=1 Tax=Pleurodeles waltl TaxID=8319 RepID=A0AAV7PRF4_PLEWA|nr:hypothetical protein NDU88_006702 [Pleurodeles waltl]
MVGRRGHKGGKKRGTNLLHTGLLTQWLSGLGGWVQSHRLWLSQSAIAPARSTGRALLKVLSRTELCNIENILLRKRTRSRNMTVTIYRVPTKTNNVPHKSPTGILHANESLDLPYGLAAQCYKAWNRRQKQKATRRNSTIMVHLEFGRKNRVLHYTPTENVLVKEAIDFPYDSAFLATQKNNNGSTIVRKEKARSLIINTYFSLYFDSILRILNSIVTQEATSWKQNPQHQLRELIFKTLIVGRDSKALLLFPGDSLFLQTCYRWRRTRQVESGRDQKACMTDKELYHLPQHGFQCRQHLSVEYTTQFILRTQPLTMDLTHFSYLLSAQPLSIVQKQQSNMSEICNEDQEKENSFDYGLDTSFKPDECSNAGKSLVRSQKSAGSFQTFANSLERMRPNYEPYNCTSVNLLMKEPIPFTYGTDFPAIQDSKNCELHGDTRGNKLETEPTTSVEGADFQDIHNDGMIDPCEENEDEDTPGCLNLGNFFRNMRKYFQKKYTRL